MEQDPGFKQLIPYVIFRHLVDDGETWLFQYTRGTGQGEQRLHRKRSVGVGDTSRQKMRGKPTTPIPMRRDCGEN